MSDLVIFGGGRLGAAVARQAAADGTRVVVASPTPRGHAGLWRHWEAPAAPPFPVRGSRVCFALGPAPGADAATLWGAVLPRLVLGAWRDGAAHVTVCGPAGAGEPGLDAFARGLDTLGAAPRTTVLRFGPLFGVDDSCVWPLLTALRQSGVARLPRGLPRASPLWIEDAARVVSRTWGEPGERSLRGAESVRMEDVGAALTGRFGGRWVWRWWSAHRDTARLRAWESLADAWDDARFGPRESVAGWVEKLPGLRRKR